MLHSVISPFPAFYIDSNVALQVAAPLRAVGHNVVTARERRREGDTDDAHLLFAAQDSRTLLTHNESDFVLLHDAWQRWSAAWGVAEQHTGILIAPQERRYGIDWDADQISEAVIECLQQCSPVAGRLFRHKEAGWEVREERNWVPCTG